MNDFNNNATSRTKDANKKIKRMFNKNDKRTKTNTLKPV